MATESDPIVAGVNLENPEEQLQELTDEQLEELLSDTLLVADAIRT